MATIARYEFNQELYSNLLPEFNGDFTNYTVTDVDNGNSTVYQISSDMWENGSISNSGTNYAGTDIRLINYFDVQPGRAYKFSNNVTVFTYDENKVFKEKISVSNPLTITISYDVKYIRFHRPTADYGFNITLQPTTTRTIESTSYPTMMRFGQVWVDENTDTTNANRCNALLNVWQLDMRSMSGTSGESMFRKCYNLRAVGTTYVTNLTSLNSMFNSCKSLTYVNCENWDTKNIGTMAQTFYGCSSLTTLDVSKWNVSSVTNMSNTFDDCKSLTTLDVSKWDTGQVVNMNNIFYGCKSLTTLDVSNWNVSKVQIMSGMFFNCSKLVALDVSKWNTQSVTNMVQMFQGCETLQYLNTLKWNVGKVTNLGQTFANCVNLKHIDVSNWNVSQVTNLGGMFTNCPLLEHLDVSKWNTSNVVTTGGFVRGCTSLTKIDMSKWNMGNVNDIGNMFQNCTSLTSVGNINNWNTSKIQSMSGVFWGCAEITKLELLNWDTSSVRTMDSCFRDCNKLETLLISTWDTSSVTNFSNMFRNCTSLTKLNISNFDLSKATVTSNMLGSCPNLTVYVNKNKFNDEVRTIASSATIFKEFDGKIVVQYTYLNTNYPSINPKFNGGGSYSYSFVDEINGNMTTRTITSETLPTRIQFYESSTNMGYGDIREIYEINTRELTTAQDMFRNNYALQKINYFNVTNKVIDMSHVFGGCTSLTEIPTPHLWDTSSNTSFQYSFSSCQKITSLDTSSWKTSNVKYMIAAFSGCKMLKELDLSTFDTSSVTNMSDMLQNCNSLESIKLENLDTSKVSTFYEMFQNCSLLKTLNLSKWNTSSCTNMGIMFSGCSSLENLYISNFNTKKTNNMTYMFRHCNSLKILDLSSFDTSSVGATHTDMFLDVPQQTIVYTNGNTWSIDTSSYNATFVTLGGRLLTTYKFNSQTHSDMLPTFNSGFGSGAYGVHDINAYRKTTVDPSTWTLGLIDTVTGTETSNVSFVRSDFIEVIPTVKYQYYTNVDSFWYDIDKKYISYTANAYSATAPDNARYVRVCKSSRPATFTLIELNVVTRALSVGTDYPTMIRFGQLWSENEVIQNSTLALLEVLHLDTHSLTSIQGLFRRCSNLVNVDCSCSWNTSQIIDMKAVFQDCTQLTRIDVSNFDMSKVTMAHEMFATCAGIEYLDVSKWDTKNITRMDSMFVYCAKLKDIDVSNWDTHQVTNMTCIFASLSLLTNIDVSKWDTSSCTNTSQMFTECKSLEAIDVSSWDVSKVQNMELMFKNCAKVTRLDVENWDVSNVVYFSSAFIGSGITSFNGVKWDVSTGANMHGMFAYCNKLTDFNAPNWKLSSCTATSSMFEYCTSLETLDLSGWDVSKVKSMDKMFANCTSLKNLNTKNWDTSSVTTFNTMFGACESLTELDLSHFNTSSATNMYGVFSNCKKLEKVNLLNWDTKNVTDIGYMFNYCQSLKELDLRHFDTSNVLRMHWTFCMCQKLTKLDVSTWDTRKTVNFLNTFERCQSLTELDLSSFSTNQATQIDSTFFECTSLETLDISNFHFGGVSQNINNKMFTNCKKLKRVAMIYCRASSFNTLINAFIGSNSPSITVYYHDANLSDLPSVSNVTYEYYDIQSITLPYELNKLPNGVADYIDVVNGVYVQRVARITFDETTVSSVVKETFNTGGGEIRRFTLYPKTSFPTHPNNCSGICDKYGWTISDSGSVGKDLIRPKQETSFWLYWSKSGYSEEAMLQYIYDNPITVLYELATPIYTPLTDEEKALLPLSAYSSGYIQLSSDELRPSKFEFRAKSNNRLQLDMLETGHYYLNAPTGNVKLGDVDIDVSEMPCIIKVGNNSNKRLVVNDVDFFYKEISLNHEEGFLDVGNGTLSTGFNDGRWASDFVEIPYYDKSIYIMNDTKLVDICYYDENKNFITGMAMGNVNLGRELHLTGNTTVKYMRLSGGNSERVLSLRSHVITLSKLPSHRIPTTFTQGMKSSVDFGYWQGIKNAKPSYIYTTDMVEWKVIDKILYLDGDNGIELHSIVGKYNGTRVTVEDEIDISTGKYTKRVGKYVIDGTVAPYKTLEHDEQYNIQKVVFLSSKTGIKPKGQWNNGGYGLAITDSLKFDVNYQMNEQHIFMATSNITLYFKAGTFGAFTLENVQNYFKENPMTVYYELETPEITYLDLEQNEFRTASNSTNLQVHSLDNSTYLKPQVKTSPLSYPTTLSPNTQYTVFHNRKNYNGSVKTPMINLGGAEVAATGSRTVVTTPSTLAHNELQFIGGENTVEQVMVLHGDWTKKGKTVDYFEGLQSSIIGDKTLENLVDEPTEIWSNKVTSNGGALDYVSMDDIIAVGYGNRAKLPEVQVGTNVRSYGMTLQNLVESVSTSTNDIHYNLTLLHNAKQNTVYTFICDVDIEYGDGYTDEEDSGIYCGFLDASASDWNHVNSVFYSGKQYKGKVAIKVTTTANSIGNKFRVRFYQQGIITKWSATNFMILEGDYSNEDIPYFARIKSVENPILTTTGKNLFDGNSENGGYSQLTGAKVEEEANTLRSVDFIKVEPSSTICCSNNGIARNTHIFEYDENKTFLKFNDTITKVILSPSTRYITFYGGNHDRDMFQLEKGDIITPYEPHKSSILSTPQGTVLRGVGSYKDVIGWNDGIIRRNCVEFTISGEEGYSITSITENTNTIMCTISWKKLGLENKILANDNVNMVICDKLPSMGGNVDTPHIRQDSGDTYSVGVWFWFDKTKFSTYTSQGINDYIKSIGGLTIVAPLANTEYEDVEITNEYSNVDEGYQVGKPLIFNHGTLYTTTDTHPSTFLDFSLKTTNRYTVKDFDKLKYTVLTEQPFNLNGVDYPASPTGMTIIDVTGIADSSIYSDDTMITVVQDDGSYYADGVLTQFKGTKTFNKEFIKTSNGTYNTGMTLLEPLELCGIYGANIGSDTYNPITGELTKKYSTLIIDKELLNKELLANSLLYNDATTDMFELVIMNSANRGLCPKGTVSNGLSTLYRYSAGGEYERVCVTGSIYLRSYKANLVSQDVAGCLEYFRQFLPIVIVYEIETKQTIKATPTSTYISTRPENGNIVAEDTQIHAEYLNYDNEQSIISPRMLGEGDEIRWEQGSQCYVYENAKEYIPLTEYDELFGANIQAQEYTQYVESVDGADIEVGVALKEKAVYEQTYVKYEDNVVYAETMENIDETNGVEVDYICGATWQNPDDLSDIRHLGELREDGQYNVTIRRSGDDEIRLLEGTTHIGLDYDELPPTEFELTFFNNGGVEVGKYGDTAHVLEDCVQDSKLASGTVYGQTLVNLIDFKANSYQTAGSATSRGINTITFTTNSTGKFNIGCTVDLKPSAKYCIKANIQSTNSVSFRVCDVKANYYPISETIPTNGEYIGTFTASSYATTGQVTFYRGTTVGEETITGTVTLIEYIDGCENWLEHFEGIGSTVVNGFSSCGKNLIYGSAIGTMEDKGLTWTWNNGIITLNGQKTEDDSYLYLRDGRLNIPNIPNNGKYSLSYRIVSGEINTTDCRMGTAYGQLTLTDGANTHGLQLYSDNPNYTNDNRTFNSNLPNNMGNCWMRVHRGAKFNNLKIQFQLERSSVHTAFEEPKSINYTLPTPITLRKVGDVCDTFDVVSGVETSKIQKLNLANYINNFTVSHTSNGKWYINFNNIPQSIEDYMNVYGDDGVIEKIVQNGQLQAVFYDNAMPSDASEKIQFAKDYFTEKQITVCYHLKTPITTKHTLIPSTTQTTQEPTFILPQPLRSVPNGICDRLYWDENKGHYCIEKRIEEVVLDGIDENWNGNGNYRFYIPMSNGLSLPEGTYTYATNYKATNYSGVYSGSTNLVGYGYNSSGPRNWLSFKNMDALTYVDFKNIIKENPVTAYYPLATPEIIDLPYLNEKVELPTQPDIYPIGYRAVHDKKNPEIGLTIPYKVLNMPTQPVNLNFVMDIADYVLTWDDVKEARQYNIILNDEVIATVKEPQYNTGEEMYGYILVEANNEIGDNLSEELYIKTVPNAPAQLTVAHNPQTDFYDFEISFIDTSNIADYYTVMYKVDNGEWVINTIQNSELTTGEKHLWSFSVYEIKESIEVWATATNDVGTNDILPTAVYYMSPTPQWTYRINSKDVFLRWLDESPYDTKYKLRYSYKSNGQFQYAYFEGDAAEIGKLYEAVLPLAEDDEITLALCIISEKENLYCKPVKASKPLDPNIVPPMNFNYHWLARGLIEFYWQDQYDVDVEYEYILESMKANETLWTQVNKIIPSEDVEGTGTIYRVEYQLEDLEQIRMKVRMKWAMNETEWTETLTTVFIPVEGNPPTYIRRTQTAEGLLVEWEAQAYIDSYHIYVIDNETGEELQHLETSDNSIIVDLDYSNSIEIAIYEISRFSGGIESDPTDSMVFTPTMFATDIDQRIYQPCAEKYPIEVSTVQKATKQAYVIHDVSYTPNVETEHEIGVSIATPFTISYHPMMVDVHQAGSRDEHTINAHIKTLNTRNEDLIRVMTFERITDVYDMDFRVYTPSVASYPINLEVSKVRIVCLGDSLTSGRKLSKSN